MTGTLPEHAHMCTIYHAHFAKCLPQLRSAGKNKICREKRNKRFCLWGRRLSEYGDGECDCLCCVLSVGSSLQDSFKMHHRIFCNLSLHLPNAVSLSHVTCSAYVSLIPSQFSVTLLFTFPFYVMFGPHVNWNRTNRDDTRKKAGTTSIISINEVINNSHLPCRKFCVLLI